MCSKKGEGREGKGLGTWLTLILHGCSNGGLMHHSLFTLRSDRKLDLHWNVAICRERRSCYRMPARTAQTFHMGAICERNAEDHSRSLIMPKEK